MDYWRKISRYIYAYATLLTLPPDPEIPRNGFIQQLINQPINLYYNVVFIVCCAWAGTGEGSVGGAGHVLLKGQGQHVPRPVQQGHCSLDSCIEVTRGLVKSGSLVNFLTHSYSHTFCKFFGLFNYFI